MKTKDASDIKLLDRVLVAFAQKDHTSFYAGCPISKTGISISSSIDMMPLADYPLCLTCKYNNRCGGCAYARRKAGIRDDAKLIGYETDSLMWPIRATFESGGETYTVKLDPGRDMGKSIMNLWEDIQPDVAVFLDLRTGYYFRITSDPHEQSNKFHGNVYGRSSKDGFIYFDSSKPIYFVRQNRWVCTWYKKNGQSFAGPIGIKLPFYRDI